MANERYLDAGKSSERPREDADNKLVSNRTFERRREDSAQVRAAIAHAQELESAQSLERTLRELESAQRPIRLRDLNYLALIMYIAK